ncbi:MAG: glycerol kinase GlpK [Candidatus Marinimicrobia bacterium]|nr:glycerol kinase GlpK [Candidatus Neomarinimicrobiota bacterium]
MYILAIDQGTTGTRAIIFDKKGESVASAYQEFTQIYPQPGWVEHDPMEIWDTVVTTIGKLPAKYKKKISAAGITNQRETTVVWNKHTGQPVHNAIVWQCRRTSDYCQQLQSRQAFIRSKTGLPVDAYFSGTKIKWLLENSDYGSTDDLLFGTIDTWLIWKLTNGQIHATDFTNASRTMIYNIHEKKWDKEICKVLDIPIELLPEVKKSSEYFGTITALESIENIPILGVAGDQQAALFGQCCFEKGEIKNTYGTGCFIMLNTGPVPVASEKGLITTLAIDQNGGPAFALEGAVFIGGAVIQWLRDELGIVRNAAETEKMARTVMDNNGVYFVPAFVGLGTPHWDPNARGTITGLTRGASKNHLVRAALESIAFQTNDVLETMETETGIAIQSLFVDGGATGNNFLMQFQSDISQCRVCRPRNLESTALGAAFLAGLKNGFWKNADELKTLKEIDKEFSPVMKDDTREKLLRGWKMALRQTMVK